jgi:hypothetical protein
MVEKKDPTEIADGILDCRYKNYKCLRNEAQQRCGVRKPNYSWIVNRSILAWMANYSHDG